MARLCRGGVIVVIGSPVRIGRGPSAIGGPIAHSSEIVGRPSALGAAVAVDAQSRRRATTAGSCTPPAGAGAVRSHQRQARCGESLAVGKGCFEQTRAADQCRKKGLLSPKGGTRTKPPPREPNLPKNAASKMDPNEPQRETERGLIALVMAVSPSRSRASMACTDRCAGLAAQSQCMTCVLCTALHCGRNCAKAPNADEAYWARYIARAEGRCWREVGCDGRQGHPSTRADAVSTQSDASRPAHANAIVMIWHVPPVAARAGAALRR